ncbi:hypothetical protein K469DRAFT_669639 [Zopfia rhizophila CBS 207.26]|uniref:FAD-binding FR-type domain-containing protein n=1 Tax=Zopfia rhizophila CBS 207.26 TaxID=1314779 RepID=A0A6A6DWA2_9PEZI|nr:hypothetical protein K469DRAFT_669639 [Zopfia rhizophila CBS 207.26]
MDITQWYGVALGALAALILIISNLYIRPPVFLLKHIFYPQIHPLIRGASKTTRFEAILIGSFLVGNVLCTTLGIKSSSDFVKRTALASVINIIPLFFGGRINTIGSFSGIKYEAYARIHRWIGRIAIAECIVHSTLAAASQKSFRSRSQISGLIATSIMATIYLSSTKFVRRHFYEAFAKLHLILAPLAIISIWLHIPSQEYLKPPKVYLLITFSLYGAVLASWFVHVTYRNFRRDTPLNVAEITSTNASTDVVTVQLKLSRPWRIRPGQFLYFRLLTARDFAFLQSHPFYICSWDSDTVDTVDTVSLLVEKRHGFTANLLPGGSQSEYSTMKAIVEGPFGGELRLESYGTVILFATGIGIAAQLPYIRHLLEGHQHREVTAQRIVLFWEIESEVHRYWVGDIMDDLLSMDVRFILRIKVFIKGNFIHSNRAGNVYYAPKANRNQPKRLKYHYYPFNAEVQVGKQIGKAKGKTIISLCTNSRTTDEIRAVVCQRVNEQVALEVLDFQPETRQSSGSYLSAVRDYLRSKRYAINNSRGNLRTV